MSVRNKIFQGQGIVREFYKVSGKFFTFGKINEKRHGISHNVRENDHFRQHDSPVSTYIDQLAKSRLKIFSISTFSDSLIMGLRLFCWHHLWKRSLILRYAPYNLPSTLLLLRFVREIWILSGRCQGNVREFWRSLMLWTLIRMLHWRWGNHQ